jgi:hypothetical protein
MVRSDQEHLVGWLVRCITKNEPLRTTSSSTGLILVGVKGSRMDTVTHGPFGMTEEQSKAA